MRRLNDPPSRYEVRFSAKAWRQVGEISSEDFDELYQELARVADMAAISEGLISRSAAARFGIPLVVRTPTLEATYDLDSERGTVLVVELIRL